MIDPPSHDIRPGLPTNPADSSPEKIDRPRLPANAIRHRVRFVNELSDGQTVLMEFTDPAASRAILVSPHPDAIVDSAEHGADDAIEILTVPGNPRDDCVTTDELTKWVTETDVPGMTPPITITLHGTHVVWRPRRAAIVAAPDRTHSLLLALVEFSFYERELGKLEQMTAEAWPRLEADMSLAVEATARDLKRLESVGWHVKQMLTVRMRWARIGARVHRPGPYLPSLANQLGERLREIARIDDRLESLDTQLEVFDRIYEMSSQRLSDFRATRQETSLEWVIIVLLVAETLLLLIEVFLSLERR